MRGACLLDGEAGGLKAVVACERRGEELVPEILRRLNTSFVTPFDREDVHAVAEALDDFVDEVMEVGLRLQLGNRDVVARHASLARPAQAGGRGVLTRSTTRLDPQQVRGSRQAAIRDVRRL